MPTRNGIILIFSEPEREREIEREIRYNYKFSEAINLTDWKFKQKEICIISTDNKNLNYVGIAEKGKKVVSYKNRVEIKNIEEIQAIPIDYIISELGNRFKKHFIHSATGFGGKIPEGTWNDFLNILQEKYYYSYKKIKELTDFLNKFENGYDISKYENIAQEKDAVGLALDIFGEDRNRIITNPESFNDEDDLPPFLSGLGDVNLLEDEMIIHDSKLFSDWNISKNIPVRASAMFEKNGERLTIMNANRNNIEHTLGVDLVYYHHRFNSFVLVQYKRLIADKELGKVYRPNSDNSYKSEIMRMRIFVKEFINDETSTSTHNYRLNNMPFYFKICDFKTFEPLSSDLIKGMYIPLDYWENLIQSEQVKGERGGVVINYDTAQRWLNNSDFINLFQSGWIGTSSIVSNNLNEIIKGLIEQDHSVIIAMQELMRR